ncbi:hypothetical protein A1O3_03632 [Capronia epimyces CBS 606.96]|uniref:Exonuclease V n=1 Tax=Capronia epimyces CBS 606.96 TaxID=1182542 RepID=W9YWL8_9EURO|nr:uncharacterized protein A1O3_03632 [Capronia epimyces CBS 606.96]EXJ86679.1 hypothetical protein A1O3_03632 [Capronia epimyces CBS 606.96]
MSNLLDRPRENDTPMPVDTIDQEVPAEWQDNDDEYSDFGEDPEELEIVDRLLLEVAAQQTRGQNAPLVVTDIEDYEAPRGVRLPKVFGHETTRQWDIQEQIPDARIAQDIRDPSSEVRTHRTDEEGRNSQTLDTETPGGPDAQPAGPEAEPEPDTRSPLERFRRPPKKALSVTDLVSPAWCELQYFYVLTKHGRKRRTPAMKQGSAVHQALEDEVHATVPVTITTKEDSWGLRIWNIIQGLRTLRETGKTRELEVWGSIGGELVNGVIDELSYHCPDPKLEEQSLRLLSKQDSEPPLPEYQASIRDYLVTSDIGAQGQTIAEALSSNNNHNSQAKQAGRNGKSEDERRIYLTDVKTRGSSTLPTGSSVRPTIVQLHLYHHMLENLAQGHFSLDHLASRYRLDVHATFSDAFIAQVGNLNQELFVFPSSQTGGHPVDEGLDEAVPSSQDSIDILLQHSNIASLWSFMLAQFRETFLVSLTSSTASKRDLGFEHENSPGHDYNSSSTPQSLSQNNPSSTPQSLSQIPTPPSFPTRLSPLLTVRYVSTSYDSRSGSKLLGSKSIIFNPSFLKSYLYDALAFWRGERSPKGVEVHDAWKCRVCEFRDGCEWIHERNELRIREAEERRKMRESTGIDGQGRDIEPASAVSSRSRV